MDGGVDFFFATTKPRSTQPQPHENKNHLPEPSMLVQVEALDAYEGSSSQNIKAFRRITYSIAWKLLMVL